MGTSNGSYKNKKFRKDEKASMTYREGLPDLFINMILCLLSAKLAVRTSILSKQWARVWSSVPVLDFDEEEDQQPFADDRLRRRNFMNFLRRCIKCRDKEAPLEKLRLRMTYLGGDKSINKWLSFAFERNVKELDISFKRENYGVRCKHYYLPWAVLSIAKSLTSLKLENVRIKDNIEPISLSCLRTMALKFVQLSNMAFSHLISGCPSLEVLSLASCSGWDVKLSSSTLKLLDIICSNIKIKVEAPKLEVFKLSGHGNHILYMCNEHFDIASCRTLKNLEFFKSIFADGWFEGLDSRFPVLEGLVLHHCRSWEPINVFSRSLQRLLYCDFGRTMSTFTMKAPKLSEATIIHEQRQYMWNDQFSLQNLMGNFNSCEKMSLHVTDEKVCIHFLSLYFMCYDSLVL